MLSTMNKKQQKNMKKNSAHQSQEWEERSSKFENKILEETPGKKMIRPVNWFSGKLKQI